MRIVRAALVAAFTLGGLSPLAAQQRLVIDVTNPVIEPLPIAVPDFIPADAASAEMARQIADVVAQDLVGTGLFREIPPDAYISQVTSFEAPVAFADWKAINTTGLVTGAVSVGADGRLVVKFRLFDIFSEQPLGDGQQFAGTTTSWRRMAHKIADQVYARVTGEGPYFDSRVVFVAESGPKDNRAKRLAIMDYDGANVQYLTDSSAIVLAPRFSPSGDRVLYTSYESGNPEIMLLDVASVGKRALIQGQEGMSVAPSFSPDGNRVAFSVAQGGNSDIYTLDIGSGQAVRLTDAPSIETAPAFSPDGSRIVFESDRTGTQQIYVMPAGGGEAVRISAGQGRYGTPVWSPRGDLIAFTKQHAGRFHIGVMRTHGSEERLLTAAFDEGPTWSPNGRVIMFTRTSMGADGAPSLYSVDISGRNLKKVVTDGFASDPAWSPLLP
jgi:TolB protein